MTTLESTSKLTSKQERVFRKDYTQDGQPYTIIANVRHDDRCRNGHNTFSITGDLYSPYAYRGEPTITHESGKKLWLSACGCLHDDIQKHFPELAPLIKWHLCSTDGPMHYVANTVYHVKQNKLGHARSTAIWPDATDEELDIMGLEDRLIDRLPALMEDFRAAVESLGLTY